MAEYIETETDGKLFDAIEREAQTSDYSEDDAVEIVRLARRLTQE